MRVHRAERSTRLGNEEFTIVRARPGLIRGPDADPAFGPLSVIDRATMRQGKVVAMHEHRDDEILTYMVDGTMVHADNAGNSVPLSARKLMMMNAGAGFRHEENAVEGPVRLLQIFIRPREASAPAEVAFHDRPDGVPTGRWGLVAGPERSGAPLRIRNAVQVYDARLDEGDAIDAPIVEGLSPFLHVFEGVVEIGGERLGPGDAVGDVGSALPAARAFSDALLVLFLVDLAAAGSRAGTISGR